MNKKINFRKKTLVISLALMMVSSIFVLPSGADNGGTYDYVIITTNAIVGASEELGFFIHMKEINGHSVLVVTEDDFGSKIGQYPNDRADKIRKWLIDNYVGLGIDYVLFIGDPDPDDPQLPEDHVGDIPMKMCLTTTFTPNNPGIPTDLYFGDLDSNWDMDGDGMYCEIATDLTGPKSPDPTIHEDTFSILWVGQVYCNYSTDYTFWTFSDDAVNVSIDGNWVINNWVSHDQTIDEATLTMSEGFHDIIVAYREDYGDAIIRLYWRTEVDKDDPCYIGDELIPSENLYDSYGFQNGLTGFYYDEPDLESGYRFERKDSQLAFFWGTGDKTDTDPDHHAEVAVGRIPVYDNDYDQLDEILRKIIDYETDPGDINWRKSILLPMVPMNDITTSTGLGEALRGMAIFNGFSYYRIYEEDYGLGPEATPCTPENTYTEWANGYGMVTWHTHGGKEGASHVIDITHLVHLDDTKPAFLFQASCHNAWPECKTNLAYSLLKQGGIAMAAATRMSTGCWGEYTFFDPSSICNHDMAYFYTKNIIVNGLTAGDSLDSVKYNQDPMGANTIRYVLYGDPECYLLTTFPNEFPVADAGGPYTGYEGSAVSFDASLSNDSEGDPLEFRWDFDDDGTYDTDWSSSPYAEYTWGDDHSGFVTVEVRDLIGKTNTSTSTVTVENVKPTTTLDTLNQPNPQFILPLIHNLIFEGSFTDPGWLDTHTSEWDFGDSTTTPGIITEENDEPYSTGTSTAEHVYSAPGTYTITLTITDDEGGSDSDTMEVEVVDEFGALQDIDDYIQNLPNSAFKEKANQRKNAMHNMINAIHDMLVEMEYNGATQDLINNIRAKADGYIDGLLLNDWITDPDAQYHLCMKIDDLTAYLALL